MNMLEKYMAAGKRKKLKKRRIKLAKKKTGARKKLLKKRRKLYKKTKRKVAKKAKRYYRKRGRKLARMRDDAPAVAALTYEDALQLIREGKTLTDIINIKSKSA